VANDPARAGPSGIVKVSYAEKGPAAPGVAAAVNDGLVIETLCTRRRKSRPLERRRDAAAGGVKVGQW